MVTLEGIRRQINPPTTPTQQRPVNRNTTPPHPANALDHRHSLITTLTTQRHQHRTTRISQHLTRHPRQRRIRPH
ncbi:hypothetical protein ACFWBZ_35815, partial [Streptomyces griseus]|uniref:hypothetical protein n=1 Tax=Streptomyces griseus TaxID=1911 RepID=UPI0036C47D6E